MKLLIALAVASAIVAANGIAAVVAPGFSPAAFAQTDNGSGRSGGSSSGSGADGGRTNLDRLVPMPEAWRRRGGDTAGRVIVVPEREPRREARRPPPRRRTSPPRRTGRPSPPAQPATPAQPAAPPVPTERPGEIVAAGIDDAALASLAADGYAVLERVTIAILEGDVVRLSVPAGTDLAAAQAAVLAAAPGATVDVNTVYTPSQGGCEGLACLQLALVGWPAAARTAEACGSGVTIGIIDTGINPEHDALKAADVTLLPLLGRAPVISRQTHGTAVAAVLVGSGDPRIQGLLPAARLVAVDAFEEDPAGRTLSDAFRLVAALDTLAQEEPQVMNLSLSGPANDLLARAITAVSERDVILVAAVGNAGPASPPLYPAAYPEVVAATAVDADLRIYRRAVRGDHVDFAAPGVEVWTAASLRGARPQTGTSFAAPFVTAALALAVERGATDREAAIAALRDGAEDLGEPGRDSVFGWGLVKADGLCAAPAGGAAVATAAAGEDEAVPGAFTPAAE